MAKCVAQPAGQNGAHMEMLRLTSRVRYLKTLEPLQFEYAKPSRPYVEPRNAAIRVSSTPDTQIPY